MTDAATDDLSIPPFLNRRAEATAVKPCNCLVCGGHDADAVCINQLEAFEDRNADLRGRASVLGLEVQFPTKDRASYILRGLDKGSVPMAFPDLKALEERLGRLEVVRKRLDETKAQPVIPQQVLSLASRVLAFIEKAEKYIEKAEQHYKSAGLEIKKIKEERPEDWETIVKDQCGIRRSRAYELMQIADGRTTLEEVRASANEHKRVERSKKVSVTSRTERDRQALTAIANGEMGDACIMRMREAERAEEMPTEEEADESWQNTLYDQACLLLERMTEPTRQKLFAHIDQLRASQE